MVSIPIFIRDRINSIKRSISWFEIPPIASMICIKIDPIHTCPKDDVHVLPAIFSVCGRSTYHVFNDDEVPCYHVHHGTGARFMHKIPRPSFGSELDDLLAICWHLKPIETGCCPQSFHAFYGCFFPRFCKDHPPVIKHGSGNGPFIGDFPS